MRKYYITTTSYNVLYEEIEQTFCEYEGRKDWAQPSFQRCWTEILFDSEYEALCELRKLYPERMLTVLEDTGKVVSTYAHESGLTSMVIRKELWG